MLVRCALTLAVIFVSPAALAEGRPKLDVKRAEVEPAGGSRRIERLEDQIEEKKKALAQKKRELAKTAKDLAQAEAAINLPRGAKAGEGIALSEKKEELQARQKELQSEIVDLKDEIERDETRLERIEVAAEQTKKPATCENCETKKAAPHQGKSGWEGFAEVLKAATPLGLGGMNTWLGYQGVKSQSSDYNLYANSMIAQGLPIQPSANNYSSVVGSATGANSALMNFMNGGNSSLGMNAGFSMNSGFSVNNGISGGMTGFGGTNMMMPNMYGSGYGNGFPSYGMGFSPTGYGNYAYSNMGGAYMSPQAAYGASGFNQNGMNYYNPYGAAFYSQYNSSGLNSFYQNQLMQSQAGVYSAQQRALLGQDAQVAQQSLSEAYSRYNYVMQQMGGGTSGYYYSGAAAPSVNSSATGAFNTNAVPSFSASAARY